MILFRDYGSKLIRWASFLTAFIFLLFNSFLTIYRFDKQVNIGVELPFEIGDIKKVDIACDASTAKDNQRHLIISDIYIRKLKK